MGSKHPKDPRLVRENELFMDESRTYDQVTYTDSAGLKFKAAIVVRANGRYVLRYGGTVIAPWLLSFTTVYADADGYVTEVVQPKTAFGKAPEVGERLGAYLTGTVPEGLA